MQPSGVTFTVPNFIDADGISYTDIEICVEMEGGDIRDTVQFVKTLERPLALPATKCNERIPA
jgi:hypothetical protein